jgi:sortase A
MKNKCRKLEAFLILSGIILIIAALALLMYDMHEDHRAGQEAADVVEKLEIQGYETSEYENENADENNVEQNSNTANPLCDESDTGEKMTSVEINGGSYIGRIDIPALNISLPVMNEWSYPNLKAAPCRYYGSVYSRDMVIAAHNYESFFGLLKDLDTGSRIIFTDVDGNEFDYDVEEITLLSPWDTDKMTSGEYPLTLFTCNYSGQQRVTVRCVDA